MRARINPTWVKEMQELLSAHKSELNYIPFEPQIISYNPAGKWLVTAIAQGGLIPKVENLGAGVRRIGIKGTCCPFCGKVC